MAAFKDHTSVRLLKDVESNVRENLGDGVVLKEGELTPVKMIPAGSEGLIVSVLEAREPVYLVNFMSPFPASITVEESKLEVVETVDSE